MDQDIAESEPGDATPIFAAYRRGYDPEQVDRYLSDQQRRLDDALRRASEAERRLAAAIGQLRELHRRITVLESERKPVEAPALDTLGDRIQRVLQEAWEGAHALRQSTELDAAAMRDQASADAEEIVSAARQKAAEIEASLFAREEEHRERLAETSHRAAAQIKFLHQERKSALGGLLQLRDAIDSTVGEIASLRPDLQREQDRIIDRVVDDFEEELEVIDEPAEQAMPPMVPLRTEPKMSPRRAVETIQPPTMAVYHLGASEPVETPDKSELVRSHRARVEASASPGVRLQIKGGEPTSAPLFDFEEEQAD